MAGEGDSDAEGTFRSPRVSINRVYTRRGDGGDTRLAGGDRVPKNHLRVEAYGSVDELNAFVGSARESVLRAVRDAPALSALADTLAEVQHELFNLGSLLATPAPQAGAEMPRVTAHVVEWLEAEIDRLGDRLPALKSFVLPGGGRLAVDLHLARTVCRRAERRCVSLAVDQPIDATALAFLNRLSDALFVWSRWASAQLGEPELLWDPNAGSSKLA